MFQLNLDTSKVEKSQNKFKVESAFRLMEKEQWSALFK